MNVKHPEIKVRLVGTAGAMAPSMALPEVRKPPAPGEFGSPQWVKKNDSRYFRCVDAQEAAQFMAEAMSGNYDHLLQTCMRWVNCE